MTQDEIIEMAKKAGWDAHQAEFDTRIQSLAKLVAQHERDRMCEQCKWRNHENTTHNEAN